VIVVVPQTRRIQKECQNRKSTRRRKKKFSHRIYQPRRILLLIALLINLRTNPQTWNFHAWQRQHETWSPALQYLVSATIKLPEHSAEEGIRILLVFVVHDAIDGRVLVLADEEFVLVMNFDLIDGDVRVASHDGVVLILADKEFILIMDLDLTDGEVRITSLNGGSSHVDCRLSNECRI
jgi:hypothetical protein